jgi:hypothetical protein
VHPAQARRLGDPLGAEKRREGRVGVAQRVRHGGAVIHVREYFIWKSIAQRIDLRIGDAPRLDRPVNVNQDAQSGLRFRARKETKSRHDSQAPRGRRRSQRAILIVR